MTIDRVGNSGCCCLTTPEGQDEFTSAGCGDCPPEIEAQGWCAEWCCLYYYSCYGPGDSPGNPAGIEDWDPILGSWNTSVYFNPTGPGTDTMNATYPGNTPCSSPDSECPESDVNCGYPPGFALQQTLDYSWDSHSESGFGQSIAIDRSGKQLIVGQSDNNKAGSNAQDDPGWDRNGTAHIFTKDESGRWIETAALMPSDNDENTQMFFGGGGLAIEGNVAVVGLSYNSLNTSGVYIFNKVGDDWVEVQKIDQGYKMGASVALQGNTLVLGKYTSNQKNGEAVVFTYNGKEWVEEYRLQNPVPYECSGFECPQFGSAIKIHGNRMIIGAWYHAPPEPPVYGMRQGAVHVYERTPNNDRWQYRTTIYKYMAVDDYGYPLTGEGWLGNPYGVSMDIHGDVIIIGEYPVPAGFSANRDGRVYVYRYVDGEVKLEFQTTSRADYCGHAVAVHEDRIAIGYPRWGLTSVGEVGRVEYFKYNPTTNVLPFWKHEGTLIDPEPRYPYMSGCGNGCDSDYFGDSLVINANEIIVGAPGGYDVHWSLPTNKGEVHVYNILTEPETFRTGRGREEPTYKRKRTNRDVRRGIHK